MNLNDAVVDYIELDKRIFNITSPTAMLEALRLLGSEYLGYSLETRSRYQERQYKKAMAELEYRGIVSWTSDETGKLKPVYEIPQGSGFGIPGNVNYEALTLAEMKTLFALFAQSKYKRPPYFQYSGQQADLATAAGLTRASVITALRKLETRQLIRIIKEPGKWKTRSKINLLDPTTGFELYLLGLVNRTREAKLSPIERYHDVLDDADTRQQFARIYSTGRMDLKLTTTCPWCRKQSFKLELRDANDGTIPPTKAVDHWKCWTCNISGDSARLYAKERFNIAKRRKSATGVFFSEPTAEEIDAIAHMNLPDEVMA
jgi:hypothetical protein